jgi:phospholipase C
MMTLGSEGDTEVSGVIRRRWTAIAIGAVALAGGSVAAASAAEGPGADRLGQVDHIVVIYQENHSFDNLYGGWEAVRGLGAADAAHTVQVNQAGTPFTCLQQNDVNLTSPPLSATCTDTTTGTSFSSHFPNAPFLIDTYIPATATTCPAPGVFAANGVANGTGLAGGCTRDLVHRYYQEPYQIDNGKQDRYMTASDAVGLTMGHYDTTALPIYKYLHAPAHPRYAIADAFFQSAFGGSFLNHQWLIAADTPTWPNAVNDGGADDLHSVLDANGIPTNSPLYATAATYPLGDRALTQSCAPAATRGPLQPAYTCGDAAVNTIQPAYQPYVPGTAVSRRLPPQTGPTIGDRLSAKGVDWAWYSGGWSNANGDVGGPGWTNGSGGTCGDANTAANAVYPNCPGKLFQYHHQPFNYFANYAPGTAARTQHLRDEAEFISAANASSSTCSLKPVSFIKPEGDENEHPGYASEPQGGDHLVNLIKAIEGGTCAKNTMVVVTYDEFGGAWDHVSPPGQGGAPGAHDKWGPGTRIPALIVAPELRGDFVVDHTTYDTTSILATIEQRFGAAPVATRDAQVNSLGNVFEQHGVNGDSTVVEGTVGATLSLSLGAPASFGAFQPGFPKEYTASTTALVISSAANATLTVSDPSTNAPGHLVNGAFSLPQPLRVGGSPLPATAKTYGGPVSNDVSSIEFEQAIGANDALRTGSYSKTLVFTLSTTSP